MATTKTDPKLALTANGAKKNKLYEGLTREQLIQAYRLMYTCLLYTSDAADE